VTTFLASSDDFGNYDDTGLFTVSIAGL